MNPSTTQNLSSARRFSRAYFDNFGAVLSSGSPSASAALYEGSLTTGGYAVPVLVAGQIIPLGPQDSAIRRLATVIETEATMHYPGQVTASTAAARAEMSMFGGAPPAMGTFTLDAFATGLENIISFEAAQDIPALRVYLETDAIYAVDAFEESKFLKGSGVGEPQGIIGNVGTGVTGVLAGSDNYPSELLTATFDVLAELKAVYHAGASWLMARATARDLRKAARANNDPAFTRENGQDYLHGYPIAYSEAMPAIAAGMTPVLFGNVAAGYLIGDRGGDGLNIKLLDQLLAAQGLFQFLAFRRTDGRVRRAEAIQPIVLHS